MSKMCKEMSVNLHDYTRQKALALPYTISKEKERLPAVLVYMNINGTELGQVVYIHRTLCRSGWPGGFSALNPSPHFWVFTSVLLHSSLRSYFFTKAHALVYLRFRDGLNICWNCTKEWHRTYIRYVCSAFEISAAQLHSVAEIASKSPFLCVNRFPAGYDLNSRQRKSFPVKCEDCLRKKLGVRGWRANRFNMQSSTGHRI